ncbi:MAG: hypothetical protein ACRD82_19995 [Blastocatellia bacterium]
MNIATYEGVVEQGQIKLKNGLRLREKTAVYVVVPDAQPATHPTIHTPRLADSQQADEFKMEIEEAATNANL